MAIERDLVFGCELATQRLDKDGYAFYGKTRAHIHAWTSQRGPVPEGMEIDHACRRRNCCALHHLRLVTRSQNEKLKSFRNRLKYPCPKKHDMNVNRVLTPEGGVTCRECNRVALAMPMLGG